MNIRTFHKVVIESIQFIHEDSKFKGIQFVTVRKLLLLLLLLLLFIYLFIYLFFIFYFFFFFLQIEVQQFETALIVHSMSIIICK